MQVTRYLRDRAESYSRDSLVLKADGDEPMAAAYRAIAQELRKCADEVAEDGLVSRLVAEQHS